MSEPVESKPVDRWLPWLFVLFFVVVLAANGIMVYVAAVSWTGLETKQHYVKGRDYNRTLEAVERQKALGWTGDLVVTAETRGDVRIGLTLLDRRKLAVAGAEVAVRFVRPTNEGYDVEVPLEDRGRGHYGAAVGLPLPGQWDMRVFARHPSGEFRLTRRVAVP